MLCYIAFHGNPEGDNRTRVGSGRYPVHGVWPDGITQGDYLLLYCFDNYREYASTAPCMGVVRAANKSAKAFSYASHWLRSVVTRDELEQTMREYNNLPVLRKLAAPRQGAKWVFEIDRRAFESLTDGRFSIL